MSFLPLAHLGERGLGYWRAMVRGSTTTYCPDPTQLARALVEARPTWIFAAPRIWERLMAAITADAREEEPAALRERFGLDRLEHAITGAAPCPEHVLEFFRALGIPIVELWGMTEVWIGTLTRPGDDDIGTVGRAQAGFELRLAPDGELLIRGPAVTPGYLNRPDATAELFDADGWLRTGDLATIDGEGRVRIVDRKKEMFISSAGHNMSPANIEAKLKASSPLIAQVCCFGDGRDYNIAVITLEPAAARRFASDRGATASSVAELALEPAVLEEVAAGIARANEQLDGRERIVRHVVLPDEWTPGVELTPTMKLRRRSIGARYGYLIERPLLGVTLFRASLSDRLEAPQESAVRTNARTGSALLVAVSSPFADAFKSWFCREIPCTAVRCGSLGRTLNPKVVGSIPTRPIIERPASKALMWDR